MPLANHTDANDKPVSFMGAFAFHALLLGFTVAIPSAIFYGLLLLFI